MTFTRTILLPALVLCCLVPGAVRSAPGGDWKGHEVDVEGTTHVRNPGEGFETPRVVQAKELWTLDEESSGLVFGNIQAAVDVGGGVTCVLDEQLSLIYVVGPDGQDVRTIGGSGEGPGEFLSASDMTVLSDTTLCISQFMPARLVKITVGGSAAGDYPLETDLLSAFINGCQAVDGGLVLFLGQMTQDESSFALRTYFARVDEEGRAGPACWEMLQKADVANVTFDEKEDDSPTWAASADGRVFVNASWDDYTIEVAGPGDDEHFMIEREYEPLPRPKWQRALVDLRIDKRQMAASTTISETARTLVRIVPRADGTVWVLSGRGENDVPADCMMVFDEFDRSGKYVREVRVMGPYQPGRDVFFVTGDRLVVITNNGPLGGSELFDEMPDTPDSIEIHCYGM